MYSKKYNCPVCGEELVKLKCENPDCSFAGLTPDQVGDSSDDLTEKVIGGLVQKGDCYINRTAGTLEVEGKNYKQSFSLNGPARNQIDFFHAYLLDRFSLRSKEWTANRTRELLSKLRDSDNFPVVDFSGDSPLLIEEDGELVFPVTEHRSSRFIQTTLGVYYYTGPVYKPRRHKDISEKWLDSFRFVSEDDKQILKQWIVGALLQDCYTAGGAPALMFVGREGCNIGKSESAKMVGLIFGDVASMTWETKEDKNRNIDRELLGGNHKFLLIDNLAQKNIPVIDEPKLAAYLTRAKLSTKRLYGSGQLQAPKVILDIITANSPIISPELLSRVVCVGLTNKKPKTVNWVEKWKKNKQKIIEEFMFDAMLNWANNRAKTAPDDFRFTGWYAAVSRAIGRRLTLYPAESCVGSPLDLMLESVFMDGKEEVEAAEAIPQLKTLRTGTARLFRKQNPLIDKGTIRMFLDRWSYSYETIEEGDNLWIKPK